MGCYTSLSRGFEGLSGLVRLFAALSRGRALSKGMGSLNLNPKPLNPKP